jgi:putative oxidoreductase
MLQQSKNYRRFPYTKPTKIMKAFIPSKVAEIIFALIIGYFGVMHFKNAGMMKGYVPAYMPGGGEIWVYVTGAALILAAIAIIIGIQKTSACYLLAALMLVFVVTLHIKNFSTDPSGTLKDAAIAMAAILIGNGSKS